MPRAVFCVVTAWLTPVMAVAAFSCGLPFGGALALGAVLAGATSAGLHRPLTDALAPVIGEGRTWGLGLFLLLAALSIVQISRASLFAADVNRVACSVLPGDPFRVGHSCLSAYAEAARFAQSGDVNIYTETLYQPRTIGRLTVDTYHYPPPFLLIPGTIHALGGGFFVERARWFVLQALVLVASILALARWIGGRPGAASALAGLALLCLPQTMLALQTGNFQVTAIPLALVALTRLMTGGLRTGAPVLALMAASKIFPGVLIVYLAAARQWRALAWTAGAGLALVLLTLAVFGSTPFVDFVRYEVPRISDGRAFPQSELPAIVANNLSVYGLTVRLRRIGFTSLDQPTGLAVTSGYGALVLLLAALAGRTNRLDLSRAADRLLVTQVGLALLTLASFRSPFVGGVYGLVSSFWLLFLIAAGSRPLAAALWSGAALLFVLGHWQLPSPPIIPPLSMVWLSLGLMTVAIVICWWAALKSSASRAEVSDVHAT